MEKSLASISVDIYMMFRITVCYKSFYAIVFFLFCIKLAELVELGELN